MSSWNVGPTRFTSSYPTDTISRVLQAAQYQRSVSGGHPGAGHHGPTAGASSADRYPSSYQPQAILQSSYSQHGQGYNANPSSYEGQYGGNEYSNSHYPTHNYYQNE